MEKSKRKNKSLNDQTRALIIDKIENLGQPIVKVAADLQINVKTVGSILKIFRETGRIKKEQKGHAIKKINAETSSYIERMIENDSSVTLKMIKEAMLNAFNITISISTIHAHLEHLKITLKRSNIILDRVNDAVRLSLRKQYATHFLTVNSSDDKNNIFIDECGFNLHLRRTQCFWNKS